MALKETVTLGNVGYTWKNGSHLENKSHLEKWVTPGKIGHTGKN